MSYKEREDYQSIRGHWEYLLSNKYWKDHEYTPTAWDQQQQLVEKLRLELVAIEEAYPYAPIAVSAPMTALQAANAARREQHMKDTSYGIETVRHKYT